ncbi:MAG: protein kinase [Deltaproteobacteria bacterium]|nr:protein kinase [Deltaproteobacteria bacterium]
MNFLCPSCRTPLPKGPGDGVVPCTHCGVQVDLTRVDTAPGTARLWPDLDLTGESLSEYRLAKRLAAGGMGVVYEAEGPQGPCAVKVLAALLAAEPELRTRFRREAAALRAIDHPGVVRIFAEGEERGFCWYSMERVPGEDLRARIARGPLPAAEVEELARSLLATLAEVHRRGFVHRDIKPGNILLSPNGPKLCDFGIARFDGSSTLTESAAVLGSLRYMAPEQRLGRTEARSDLYSLGVVLYEALATGVPGEATLPPGVPARLRRLIARLLAERLSERPADATAALVELDRLMSSGTAKGIGAAAAVAALAATTAIAWGILGGPAQAPAALSKNTDETALGQEFKGALAQEPKADANEERGPAQQQATLDPAPQPSPVNAVPGTEVPQQASQPPQAKVVSTGGPGTGLGSLGTKGGPTLDRTAKPVRAKVEPDPDANLEKKKQLDSELRRLGLDALSKLGGSKSPSQETQGGTGIGEIDTRGTGAAPTKTKVLAPKPAATNAAPSSVSSGGSTAGAEDQAEKSAPTKRQRLK